MMKLILRQELLLNHLYNDMKMSNRMYHVLDQFQSLFRGGYLFSAMIIK